jgi:pilus assembly protein Flp/PilA
MLAPSGARRDPFLFLGGGVMPGVLRMVRYLRSDERGATMAEYAMLIAVIAIVVIVGARTLGTSVNTRLNNTAAEIANG